MTLIELENLGAGLTALIKEMEGMPNPLEYFKAKFHCNQSLAIVEEYARHFRDGKEPFDALRTAAVGEFNTGEKQNVWKDLPPSA